MPEPGVNIKQEAFRDGMAARMAGRLLSQAERKMQMSSVLVEGGFPLEALTPISQAVELTLKALAYLAGEDEVEEELSLSHIKSRIIPAGLLPDNAVAVVASLRESVPQPEKLDDDAARNLIQSSQKLIHQVSQALNKSALG